MTLTDCSCCSARMKFFWHRALVCIEHVVAAELHQEWFDQSDMRRRSFLPFRSFSVKPCCYEFGHLPVRYAVQALEPSHPGMPSVEIVQLHVGIDFHCHLPYVTVLDHLVFVSCFAVHPGSFSEDAVPLIHCRTVRMRFNMFLPTSTPNVLGTCAPRETMSDLLVQLIQRLEKLELISDSEKRLLFRIAKLVQLFARNPVRNCSRFVLVGYEFG